MGLSFNLNQIRSICVRTVELSDLIDWGDWLTDRFCQSKMTEIVVLVKMNGQNGRLKW